MIEKMADDLIGQMTEARLIDKDMEERYMSLSVGLRNLLRLAVLS